MTDTTHGPPREEKRSDLPVSELVRLASEQISTLVRDELRLARAELVTKAKVAGVGAGMLGAGGVMALFGAGTLIATVALALALVLPAWAATLCVTVLLFAMAGTLALLGRVALRHAAPPVPSDTVNNVRADIETVTEAVRDRGRR